MSGSIDVFISYARADHASASALTTELEKLGISTWSDFKLVPGENWHASIAEALKNATALVVIVSDRSTASNWVQYEVRAARGDRSTIIPVVIGDFSALPMDLQHIQAVQMLHVDDAPKAARSIASALAHISGKRAQFAPETYETLARDLTAEAEQTGTPAAMEQELSSAFVVHGHDEDSLVEVTSYMRQIGVRPIILREIEDAEESLLTRFFRIGGEATFAVVIVSPDDLGAPRRRYDDPKVGDKALKFRTRQNVVLELGFFYGKLGFQNVYVLMKEPTENWPEFELPSDLAGAVYKRIDAKGKWKNLLLKAMQDRGLKVDVDGLQT